MNMIRKTDNQKWFSWCFSKSSLLFLAALIPSLPFFCFLSPIVSLSLLIAISVLFLSTVFFEKFIKKRKRVGLEENLKDQLEEEVTEKPHLSAVLLETQTQPNAAQEQECGEVASDAETSCESVASEGFELGWLSSEPMVPHGSVSDESSCFDDDEGLIEIALMGCGSNGLVEEPKQKHKQNLQSFLADSVFREEELMEINDGNEEENLIEIDISMGSIKRSK